MGQVVSPLEAALDRLVDHARGAAALPVLPIAELLEVAGAPARHHPYARQMLLADRRGEVLLMTWQTGLRCAPHDHGDARGFVFLLRGMLSERLFSFTGDGLTMVGEHAVTATANTGVRDVTSGLIHDMVAADDAVSLHVYVPRIQRMRVFDPAARRTLIVANDCGAWIPDDSSQIVEERPW